MGNNSERGSGGLKLVVILGMALLAMVGGVLAASAMLRGGGGGKTDVGDLAELAAVQAQLRAVDACRLEHNLPVRGSYREKYRRTVFVTPCGASGIAPSRGKVELPAQWAHGGLSFEAERSSRTDDWAILVNQEAVPFPVLVAGLSELAPIVAREAAGAIAKSLAEDAEGKAKYEEGLRQREQQQQENKGSYPTR